MKSTKSGPWMALLATIIAVTGIAAITAVTATAQENIAQWSQVSIIRINTSATGANVATDVANFPLLVTLDAGSFAFAQARGNGADIRFYKVNGTRLKHQIERWDSAAARAEIWVLMDTVSGNSFSQVIRMHWGNPAAPDSSNGAAVFATSRGFRGVWHLAEPPNTAVAGYRDATANANHGTANAITTTGEGAIGRGLALDGFQYVAVNNSASLTLTQTITLSAWFYSTDWGSPETATANRRIVQKGIDTSPADDYSLREVTGTQNLIFSLAGPGTPTAPSIPNPAVNGWNLIHGTYDGSVKRLYLNGVMQTSQNATGNLTQSSVQLEIGHRPQSSSGQTEWRGRLDEVRVLSVALDANWIKLEHANQRAGQTLVSMEPVSVRPDARVNPASAMKAMRIRAEGNGLVFIVPGTVTGSTLALTDTRGRAVWSGITDDTGTLAWNGRTADGQTAARGVYYVRLHTRGARDNAANAASRVIFHDP